MFSVACLLADRRMHHSLENILRGSGRFDLADQFISLIDRLTSQVVNDLKEENNKMMKE